MSAEHLFDLYSQKIIALATSIPHIEPIDHANGQALVRSPICGSQVSVQLQYNQKIDAFYQDVKACALGQASSAIFGKAVIGLRLEEIERLRHEVLTFLSDNGDIPSDPFGEYEVLTPAQAHKNRHASILLPIDATILAIKNAAQKDGS